MSRKKPPRFSPAKLSLFLGDLPRTNAVRDEDKIEAMKEHIADLERMILNTRRGAKGKPDDAPTEENREELSRQLVAEARKMLPQAVKKAREGKPGLLRLLHRIAEPKSRS
jgi:predicted component of type VI protein secretion system